MAMDMAQSMQPFVDMGIIDPSALARKLLQDGFGVKDPSQFFAQQDPMVEQMQQPIPEPGGPMGAPQLPPAGPQMDEVSPIDGIPPELVNRLDVEPSPANAA